MLIVLLVGCLVLAVTALIVTARLGRPDHERRFKIEWERREAERRLQQVTQEAFEAMLEAARRRQP